MAIFGPKPWVNFSIFSTTCFQSLERRFFLLEYCKTHFPSLQCLNKKVEKMAIFPRKPWVIPFGKMSIFRLFKLFVFIAQKGDFSFQNIVKDIFLAYSALKKKLAKKGRFSTKTIRNPNWKKIQFFDFSNFWFLQTRRAFFRSRIS